MSGSEVVRITMLLRPGSDVTALDADDAAQGVGRHVATTRTKATALDASVAA
jgi:hypothetical protein